VKQLTDILLEERLVDAVQLDEAWAEHERVGQPLGRVLVDMGHITEAQLVAALASQIGLDFVDLSEYPVDAAAVAALNPTISRRHTVLPIGYDSQGRLMLAMADPGNVFALDDVRQITGREARPIVATRDDLLAAIERYCRADADMDDITSAMSTDELEDELTKVREIVEDAPIVKYVNMLITQAIQDRASDIHVEPAEDCLRVRYRIDGVLHEIMRSPKAIASGVTSRLKIMSDIDIAERRKPQDGRLSINANGRKIDLAWRRCPRCGARRSSCASSTTRTPDGPAGPRLLGQQLHPVPDQLPQALRDDPRDGTDRFGQVDHAVRDAQRGLQARDQRHHGRGPGRVPAARHQPGAGEPQGRPDVRRGAALDPPLGPRRGPARRDPRPRDRPDLHRGGAHGPPRAVHAAHQRRAQRRDPADGDGRRAVPRGLALDAVLAQRLARKLCSKCAEEYLPDREYLQAVRFGLAADEPVPRLWRPVGCPQCAKTGYKGRLALHEVMIVSEEIERLAVTRASSTEIGAVAREQGMITLRQDGMDKVRAGRTTLEEILRVVA
jgi:type IV pilus assembly protein PilB